MGMTMTEKILAAHAGLDVVKPGQLIKATPDFCMAHDASGPIAMNYFKEAGFQSSKYPEKVMFVMDHFTPNKDVKSAQNCKCVREFALKNDINNYRRRTHSSRVFLVTADLHYCEITLGQTCNQI